MDAPALRPPRVMLSGLPPKWRMLSATHSRPIRWLREPSAPCRASDFNSLTRESQSCLHSRLRCRTRSPPRRGSPGTPYQSARLVRNAKGTHKHPQAVSDGDDDHLHSGLGNHVAWVIPLITRRMPDLQPSAVDIDVDRPASCGRCRCGRPDIEVQTRLGLGYRNSRCSWREAVRTEPKAGPSISLI